MKKNHPTGQIALAAVLCMLATSAGAGAFLLPQQEAGILGTASAGTAANDHASAAYLNPAGLARLAAPQISLAAAGQFHSVKFSGVSTVGGGNGGDAGGWLPSGGAYLAWPLGPRVSLGLAINSPFGWKTDYDAAWAGRYQAVKTDISSVAITPAVAIRVSDKVSLGAGLTFQRLDGEFSAMEVVGAADTLTRFTGDDTGWGGSVGLLWEVSKRMRIGISYRSSIRHELSGNVDRAAGAGSGAARAVLKTPDVATLSVVQTLDDRWEMLGDVSYSGWSKLKSLDIVYANGAALRSEPLLFHNTLRVSLGGIYRLSDAWRIRMGVGYERSAATDGNRGARIPDEHRITLAAGAQYRFARAASVDFGYSHVFVRDAVVATNGGRAANGILQGEFDTSVDTMGVQYTQSF